MTAVFEIAQKPYLSYLKNIRRGSPALVFQACIRFFFYRTVKLDLVYGTCYNRKWDSQCVMLPYKFNGDSLNNDWQCWCDMEVSGRDS